MTATLTGTPDRNPANYLPTEAFTVTLAVAGAPTIGPISVPIEATVPGVGEIDGSTTINLITQYGAGPVTGYTVTQHADDPTKFTFTPGS